jgi:hypothetical protein
VVIRAATGEAVGAQVEQEEPVLVVVRAVVLLAVLTPAAWSWWPLRRSAGRRRKQESAADRSLELLVADLRRLEREFRRTEQDSDVAYRTARLQAISLAYDDTLLLCCRLLDVPEPERPPWNPVTRLQIEAELARAGLDW